jgi:hypothetical protein
MATVPYSQFQPFVQVDVPACPKALIIEAIRQTVIDFCQVTGFWRKELDGFNTIATDDEYELITPVYSTIADILTIKVNERTIEAKTQDDLENDFDNWRTLTGSPKYYFLPDKKTLVLIPIPDDAYPVRIIVSLKPTQSAQDCDEIIFEEYKQAIVDGALAWLMDKPSKDWSNPNLAMLYKQKYDTALINAKNNAQKGYAKRKSFRVKANYF